MIKQRALGNLLMMRQVQNSLGPEEREYSPPEIDWVWQPNGGWMGSVMIQVGGSRNIF